MAGDKDTCSDFPECIRERTATDIAVKNMEKKVDAVDAKVDELAAKVDKLLKAWDTSTNTVSFVKWLAGAALACSILYKVYKGTLF